MKRFILAAVLVVAAVNLRAADEPTRVFIFAGQSNMVGSDAHPEKIDSYSRFKGVGQPREDVLYAHQVGGEGPTKGWEALKPLRDFGSELTFARMVKKEVSFPIAIIKSAVGGTTAAFDWNPDAPEKGQKLYPRTLGLIRESLAELDKRGVRYRLEGVMWHQGENDMLDRKINKDYAEGLRKVIAALRTDLKAPELKWYMAEVSEKGIWGMDNRANLSILRLQQQKVLDADPLIRWVPTSHLAFEVMNSGQPHYHFGTQGQLQMGEAFAAAYLKEIGKLPAAKDRTFKEGLPIAKKGRVRLFVLAGQRNMEGEDADASAIAQTPGFEALAGDQAKVIYRYWVGGGLKVSAGWEPLGPVDYLGSFGPELSFGAQLRKSVAAQEGIAIVKFTHSGAQSPDWSPKGSPESHRDLYAKFAGFVQGAMKDLAAQGYEVALEGIFWHTGENDTYFGRYRQNYAKWMKELIDQTRVDFKQAQLRWFISEQHKDAIWKNMEAINADLNQMAEADGHVVMIKTAQLPHERLHFGTRGTLMLGEEMAKAYLQAQPKP